MLSNRKILIVGPAWVGDMVMAQVLFKLLKQKDPAVMIDVLAPAWSEPLLNRMPEINRAIISPFGHGALLLKKRYDFAKKLRAERYSQAIILPNSFKSALIPFWAHIPIRTGWLGECRFGLLNNARILNKKNYPKMIDRFAALAFPANHQLPSDFLIPKFNIQPEQVEHALKKYNLKQSEKILALCPGAEFGSSKRWLPEYFAAVANQKISEGWSVWLFGSQNDLAIADEIQAITHNQCENLIGKTNLSEAVDLLSLANTVVTNDSGLMHIAAALDRKVIAIYGSTSTAFTPPLSNKAAILQLDLSCQPCFARTCPLQHHNCMKLLLPSRVLLAMSSE